MFKFTQNIVLDNKVTNFHIKMVELLFMYIYKQVNQVSKNQRIVASKKVRQSSYQVLQSLVKVKGKSISIKHTCLQNCILEFVNIFHNALPKNTGMSS